MTKLSDIETIGPKYVEILMSYGIKNPKDLLEDGATRGGRSALARVTKLSPRLISKWVNRADLFRIKGVGSEYAELLEHSGVDTVPELAQRNAEHLLARMVSVNENEKLAHTLPSLSKVENWIDQAKKLPRAIHYY